MYNFMPPFSVIAAPADPAAVSGGNQGPSRPDHIPAREDGGAWSPQGDNSVKGAMAWTGKTNYNLKNIQDSFLDLCLIAFWSCLMY